MTALEALLQIKQMFAEVPQPVQAQEMPEVEVSIEPAAPEYKEYVLKSGAKVKIDKLEVGGKVVLVDDAGNEAPAPAGEHELADGMVIVLDEASTIVEIKEPQVEEAPAPAEEELKKKIEEMQAEIEKMANYKKKQEEKMAEVETKFSQAIKDLSDVVIGLINTPSAEPSVPKQTFNKVTMSRDARVEAFLNKYARN
jgi:hypothetical protein